MNTSPTQSELILEHLQAHRGDWCAMPTLAQVSGSLNIHSRIADLRADGVQVENKIERAPDGRRLSYYRIPVPNQLNLL